MSLILTDNAASKIETLIQAEKSTNPVRFRVSVSGGGCSGFQYVFSLDEKYHPDDHVFEEKGVSIIVDEASLPFLQEAQIDYVEELIGASFQVKNPNASVSCGCGNSFSV